MTNVMSTKCIAFVIKIQPFKAIIIIIIITITMTIIIIIIISGNTHLKIST
jgi:hypothetical protein